MRQQAPVDSDFLSLLRIPEFLGFQWQTLAEILSLLSKGQFDTIKRLNMSISACEWTSQ